MAMLDKQEYFLTTAGAETLGGHASGNSDYRTLDAAEAHDGHRKKYLNIMGIADLTSTEADTVTITLVSDLAVGFATAKVTNYTSAAIAKGSVAATRLKVLLPEDMKKYYRIEWTVTSAGTCSAGGTFKAYISE
jgi:methionine-rich copper-binding protein CopC